jgi:hypothetical protein
MIPTGTGTEAVGTVVGGGVTVMIIGGIVVGVSVGVGGRVAGVVTIVVGITVVGGVVRGKRFA